MKILTASQMRAVDAYTIENEPISSLALMSRAADAVAWQICQRWTNSRPVKVFAGPGNNGGDALVVAMLLAHANFDVAVYLFNTGNGLSDDCQAKKDELIAQMEKQPTLSFTEVTNSFAPPRLEENDLVIDGLFGTGVTRPLNGGFASVVKYINASPSTVIAIDVPSGLMTEDNTYNVMNHVIKANYTFTFHAPKLSFFFPENEQYVGEWTVLSINLIDPEAASEDSIASRQVTATPYYFTEVGDIAPLLRPRPRFAHKGTMGHGALIAGKVGMAGAAILASRACLRTGLGKLTVHTPEGNADILQVTVPEAVLDVDADPNCFSISFDASDFDALAIGPGIGTDNYTVQAVAEQISMSKCPMVLDADALNILGANRSWMSQLPRKCILTPHKKELAGLIGTTRNSYEELERTREMCQRLQIYIIIKGAYSAVVTPEGNVFFNPTGNPGMATAGSGDVLTGIILSLLAQGYPAEQAACIGVYLHGLAGDIAANKLCEDSIIASDIVDHIAMAFRKLKI